MLARTAALLALGAVLLPGCDRRPHPFGSVFGDDGCEYHDTTYSHASAVCQTGRQYRCNDGQWQELGVTCARDPLVTAKSCELNHRPYAPGSVTCQSGRQYRCDDGMWRNLVATCNNGDIEARMAPDARPCRYSGATVGTQSTLCKSGITYRCEDSDWRNLGTACQ